MKLHLLARSSALASIVLLPARTINAYDDSAKIGRSLDGIFLPPQQNDTTAQENDVVIKESSTGNSTVAPAIVGGNNANPQEYPFFVWLGNCGGSLVAPDMVLSAAHCEPSSEGFATLGLHKILLDAGDTSAMFGFIEHIPFETHEVHPQYNPVTHENDLWMIKLQWPSQLYANQVVQLETPDDNIVLTSGVNLRAMGFGRLAFDGENANVLQEVTLDYFSNADCTNPLVGGIPPDWIFPGMFCAGSTSGRGTCRGDSGGPIIHIASGKQVGIVSFSKVTCGQFNPSVYQRVSAHYNFIISMISTWRDKPGKPPRNGGCTDLGGFYSNIRDEMTTKYNCLWYAQSKHCQWYGNFFAHAGLTANNACCTCGGGVRVNAKASKRI